LSSVTYRLYEHGLLMDKLPVGFKRLEKNGKLKLVKEITKWARARDINEIVS